MLNDLKPGAFTVQLLLKGVSEGPHRTLRWSYSSVAASTKDSLGQLMVRTNSGSFCPPGVSSDEAEFRTKGPEVLFLGK